MLFQHVVQANHSLRKLVCYPSIHSADTLSQHALQKLRCIKESAKVQNSGQADTALRCITRRTRTRGAAEQAAITPWKTRQEA